MYLIALAGGNTVELLILLLLLLQFLATLLLAYCLSLLVALFRQLVSPKGKEKDA